MKETAKIIKMVAKTATYRNIKPETLCFYATNSSTAWERLNAGRMTNRTIDRIKNHIAKPASKTRKGRGK